MASESLLKLLTGAGIGSRRRITEMIKQGRVTVNGEAVDNFRHPVNVKSDRILIDGQPVAVKAEPVVYLMMNKPLDVLSTTRDERGRRTVLDIIPERYRRLRLYPVGRLDKDSTGLLLLTNDGDLANRLTHPRFECEKEYLIHIDENLSAGELKQLAQGIRLEDGMTRPAVVKEVKLAPFNYSITIHEGRKRQVRRMLAALGYSILELKRVRMGRLKLGNLKEGECREITAAEIKGCFG
jgi:23S rRNA pseudouridine2605 synthase